jgi:hypothetical protein
MKMGSHFGYGTAALIREQADDIVVAHWFAVVCHTWFLTPDEAMPGGQER